MRIFRTLAGALLIVFAIIIVVIVAALVFVALRDYLSSKTSLWTWVTTTPAVTAGITAGILSAVAVSVTGLAAILVAWSQLGAQHRASYAQLRMKLEQTLDSEPYIDARHKIDKAVQRGELVKTLEEALANASRDYLVLTMVPTFLESALALARDGYISPRDIERVFDGPIWYYHNLFWDYTEKARRLPGQETLWGELEKAAKRFEKEKGWNWVGPAQYFGDKKKGTSSLPPSS